jgi:hypothetical protein
MYKLIADDLRGQIEAGTLQAGGRRHSWRLAGRQPTQEVRSLLVRKSQRTAELFLRRTRQVLRPAQQQRHGDADERVRGYPLPRAAAVPV